MGEGEVLREVVGMKGQDGGSTETSELREEGRLLAGDTTRNSSGSGKNSSSYKSTETGHKRE